MTRKVYFENFSEKVSETLIHGFRDSVLVRKLHACCYDMQKFRTK